MRAHLLLGMALVGAGCAAPVDGVPHPAAVTPDAGYNQVDTAVIIRGTGFWARGSRQWGGNPAHPH